MKCPTCGREYNSKRWNLGECRDCYYAYRANVLVNRMEDRFRKGGLGGILFGQ